MMFSPSEWPQMELYDDETSPGIEASPDMFGGDPFGYEHLNMSDSSLGGDSGADGVDPILGGKFRLNY